MSLKQQIISFASGLISTESLLPTRQPLVIHPFYHTVSDSPIAHVSPLYTPRSVAAFEQDLDYLLRYFTPVAIDQIGSSLRGHAFHLSFDDGLREVKEVIAPILLRKGIPATIFVNSAFVDNQELFYRHKAALLVSALQSGQVPGLNETVADFSYDNYSDKTLVEKILHVSYRHRDVLDHMAEILSIDFDDYLQQQRPYLTTDDLRELQSQGFTIGAHSVDHPHFDQLEEEEQIDQLLGSLQFVQQNFATQACYFAFPFGEEGVGVERLSAHIPAPGYTFGISGIGCSHQGRHIARIDMEQGGLSAKTILNKALLKYRLKKR